MFPKQAHILPSHLQDVRADDIIITCKPYRHTLQCTTALLAAHRSGAIVPHHTTDRSWALWAEAMTR
jgi:hypothetical protein